MSSNYLGKETYMVLYNHFNVGVYGSFTDEVTEAQRG